ncbi:MAG TPA: DUF4145 domain-containing protein [Terriglobales bacterium]
MHRTKDNGRDDEQGYQWSTTFEMLQCCGCLDVVLRRKFWFSEEPEMDVSYFPPPVSRQPPRWRYNLPVDSRLLLEEIYKSLDADNRRLPLMGARTLLDMLILEKVGDVGNFRAKLSGLERAGLVSSQGSEVLYAALDMGSAAAHRGHAATEYEVEAVMDIVENMLQAIYVFPRTADALKKSTPQRSKKS